MSVRIYTMERGIRNVESKLGANLGAGIYFQIIRYNFGLVYVYKTRVIGVKNYCPVQLEMRSVRVFPVIKLYQSIGFTHTIVS